MKNNFYCQSVPNSHWWTDLRQLSSYPQLELTKEHLIIGLNNSIKRGYKLKQVKELDLNRLKYEDNFFSSIELMINYIESENFDVNQFLSMVNTTWDIIGLNLNNGIIMEKTEVYKRINCELDYQDIRWNTNQRPDGVPDEEKSVAEWINYIEHHLGKAKNAVYYLSQEKALEEIRKVTALGVRTMMIHGCPERKIPVSVGGEKDINFVNNATDVPQTNSSTLTTYSDE